MIPINKVAEVYFKHIVGCKSKDVESWKGGMDTKKKVYRFTRSGGRSEKGWVLFNCYFRFAGVMVKDFASRI